MRPLNTEAPATLAAPKGVTGNASELTIAYGKIAELAKANALLLDNSRSMATARTPEAIFESFLLHAVRATQARAGGLLRRLQGTEHEFVALVQGADVVPRTSWQALPLVTQNAVITRDDRHGIIGRTVQGEDVWFPVDEKFADWAAEAAAYHRENGNRSIVLWPYQIGSEIAGYLGLAFSDIEPLRPEQRETLRALSSQASLALQLNLISSQVEEAAVLRERERSARGFLSALHHSSDVLMSSVSVSAGGVVIKDALLEQFLLQAVRVAGARGGSLALYENGQYKDQSCVVSQGCLVPEEEWRREPFFIEIPKVLGANIAGFFDRLMNEQITRDRVDDAFSWWPTAAEYHLNEGHEEVWNVACTARGQVIASFGLGFVRVPDMDSVRPILLTLAQQAALAIEFHRLSSLSMEQAVTRERERAGQERSEQLLVATEGLQAGIRELIHLEDVRAFLERLLKVAQVMSQAVLVATIHFFPDTDGTDDFSAVLAEGRPFDSSERKKLMVPTDGLKNFLEDRRHTAESWPLSARSHLLALTTQDVFAQHGVVTLRHIPIVADDQLIGFLGFAFNRQPENFDANQSLYRIIADQMTLALEMNRLAKENKAAAIAHEKEAALRARATELARVNSELRENLVALSGGGDLHQTMERLLASASEQLGAETAYIFLYDEAADSLRREFVAGKTLPPEGAEREYYFEGCPSIIPTSAAPLWRNFLHERKPITLDCRLPKDASMLWPEAVSWHLEANQPIARGVPLQVGERTLGFMGMNFGLNKAKGDFDTDYTNLEASLSSLASMAVETHRLTLLARNAAVADERTRLSEEMHDGIQQIFAAIALQLEGAQKLGKRAGMEPALREKIERTAEIAEHGVREVRRSIQALRDVLPMTQQEFLTSLRTLCESHDCEQTGCTLVVESALQIAPTKKFNELCRIIQEAVGNAYRHSKAKSVSVSIQQRGEDLRVAITDNGVGFSPERPASGGLGLTSMQQRAKRIGAQLEIKSSGMGTLVTICVALV